MSPCGMAQSVHVLFAPGRADPHSSVQSATDSRHVKVWSQSGDM